MFSSISRTVAALAGAARLATAPDPDSWAAELSAPPPPDGVSTVCVKDAGQPGELRLAVREIQLQELPAPALGTSPDPVPSGKAAAATKDSGMQKRTLGLASLLVLVPGTAIMARQIRKGVIQANKASWGLWAANDSLLLAATLATRDPNLLLLPLGFSVASATLFACASKWGEKKPLDKLEKACVGLGVFGLGCFLLSKSPWGSMFLGANQLNDIALISSGIVNMLGGVPTMRAFFSTPEQKPPPTTIGTALGKVLPWGLFSTAVACSCLSAESFTAGATVAWGGFVLTSAALLAGSIHDAFKGGLVKESGQKGRQY